MFELVQVQTFLPFQWRKVQTKPIGFYLTYRHRLLWPRVVATCCCGRWWWWWWWWALRVHPQFRMRPRKSICFFFIHSALLLWACTLRRATAQKGIQHTPAHRHLRVVLPLQMPTSLNRNATQCQWMNSQRDLSLLIAVSMVESFIYICR
jgi:hypothetical protein